MTHDVTFYGKDNIYVRFGFNSGEMADFDVDGYYIPYLHSKEDLHSLLEVMKMAYENYDKIWESREETIFRISES